MRVVYIARHGQHSSNDDEGAITYALSRLGHHVACIPEYKSYRAVRLRGDFVLFHKWSDMTVAKAIEMPKVCWYFDLVEYSDPMLEARNEGRRKWMAAVIKYVDLMFCTDGDWVSKDETGKLIWLTQGADERLRSAAVGSGARSCKILFTGIGRHGGSRRESFVSEMKARYDTDFYHIPSGVYRNDLAREISSADMVVAPDSPVTDRYWSNRVYNALGLGAFLLHPDTAGIRRHYTDGEHLVLYKDRDHLHSLIQYYADRPLSRREIAEAGYKRTHSHHTYKHRLEEICRIVKERLL